VQGAGAALLVPGSMALISAHFAQAERGRAFGLWTGFSGITSAVGPVVGGWLVDHGSWEWAFLVNLPLAAAVIAITYRHVPESAPSVHTRLDLGGALCATLALGGAAYAFTEAPTRGWSAPEVIAALLLAAVAIAAFIAVERRHPAPMLPLRLLRNRTFSGANLLTLLLYAGLGGGLFFLPLNLVQVQGMSATGAGAALLPFILVLFVLSRWAGSLVERHGARGPLVIGPVIAAAGFALLMLPGTAASYWTGFLPGIGVLGLGMAITIAPLTTTVMNAVEPAAAGVASGVNNAVSRMAGLLAIAVFGWVMALVFEPALQAALNDAALPPAVVDAAWAQRDRLGALRIEGSELATAQAVHGAVQEAFVAGFRWIMGASAALALLGAAVAAATIRQGGRTGFPPSRE
jgi:MFS family permease